MKRLSETEKLIWVCILFPIPFLPLGIVALICAAIRGIGNLARKLWAQWRSKDVHTI